MVSTSTVFFFIKYDLGWDSISHLYQNMLSEFKDMRHTTCRIAIDTLFNFI